MKTREREKKKKKGKEEKSYPKMARDGLNKKCTNIG